MTLTLPGSTLKDSQGRYLIPPAPAEDAALRLWSLPVVLSPALAPGAALVADWSRVHLLGRGQYEAVVFESGSAGSTNLAATNQLLVRAETRVGLFIDAPSAVTVVHLI